MDNALKGSANSSLIRAAASFLVCVFLAWLEREIYLVNKDYQWSFLVRRDAIARKHKISVCGVQAILRKALTTGTVEDRDMSGCPPSTIAGEDRLFYRLSLSNRTTTSRMLQKRDLEDVTGAQLFSKTVEG